MIELPLPPPLFNPLITSAPLTPLEVLAGPFGLLVYLPFVPVVVLLAWRWRRTALILSSLVWMAATLRPAAAAVALAGLAAAMGWIVGLGALRRRGRLSQRAMTALVWLGAHALIVPVWWPLHSFWYPSRMAFLHAAGLAYLMLRLIAWGVELARNPNQPTRWVDTICWLLYPPCMRLGPVMLREQFLARLDGWDPRRSPAWRAAAKRFGLFLLGGVCLGLVGAQIPRVPAEGADFFADPSAYPTHALLRVFYLVPIHVYLLLWTYNELAATTALWIGLPVDNNFDWLPRAASVREFWRRWHITLGAWLRSYIYIPLGGNRRHVVLNYVAVFAYCGVWHGASWSFVAWGLSQAAALTVQRAWDRLREVEGWGRFLRGWWWVGLCWLLTMHYQMATIIVFVDFEHLGLQLFAEIWRRLAGGSVN